MNELEQEQKRREDFCRTAKKLGEEIQALMKNVGPKDPLYNQLEGEGVRLFHEIDQNLYYVMTSWQKVLENLPVRIYVWDPEKYTARLSLNMDTHCITEVRVQAMTGKNPKKVFKFYCKDCRRIVAYVNEKELGERGLELPWSEAKRIGAID